MRSDAKTLHLKAVVNEESPPHLVCEKGRQSCIWAGNDWEAADELSASITQPTAEGSRSVIQNLKHSPSAATPQRESSCKIKNGFRSN